MTAQRSRIRLLRAAGLAAIAAAVLATGASAFAVNEYPPPPDGAVGIPYKHVFTPKDGAPPYSFGFYGGDLPPGLRIESDGTFHGTPTQAGTFLFDVNGTQCCGPDSQRTFTVRIRDRIAITTAALGSGTVGAPYSATLVVTGNGGLGMGWKLVSGALPPGLALAPDGTPGDGIISGTPATVGTYSFTVKVGDTDGFLPDRSATRAFTIAVVAPLSTAPGAAPPTGAVGKPYRATPVAATGGLTPYTWSISAGAPPPGLTLDASGALVGTPAAAGTFAFTITATDAGGRTAGTAVTVTVVGALDVVTTQVRTAKVGKPYRAKLRSRGGAAPLRWKVAKGKLPAGIKLDASAGVLTGVPKAAGRVSFTVSVTDTLGQKSSQRLSIDVRA